MGNEVKQDQVKQLIPNAAIFSASQEIISSTQSHSILQALFDCVTSAEELCEAAIYSPFSSNLANIQQTHYWRNQQLSYLPDGPIVTLGSVLDLSGAPISSYFLLDSLADSPDVPEYLRDLGSTVGFNQTLVFPIGYQNSLFGFLHITPQKTRPVLPEDIAPLMMLCKQTGLAFWQIQQERERIALDQLNHDLNHAVTHEDAGETVVSILADYSKVDNTRLFLIDSNTQSARLLIENNSTFSDFEGSPSWDDPLIFQFSHTQEPILIHANAPGEFQSAADRYLNPFHYETSLVVPIFNQLILNGFVILDSRQRNFVFSPEIIAFTIKIAKQFEIRYENLLLYDEAFKRAQELIQLNQFGERLSSTLVPQELTSIVYETTQQLFDAPIFMLGLIDHDHELITPILYKSNQRQINAKPSKISRHSSITAQIRSQETTICWQNDPLLTELYQILAVDDAAFPVTGVFAPIIQSGFGSGFIAILAFEQDIYKPDHIQLIRSIANQTGLCLSNSALLEKSENHVSELRSLFNVTQAMANGISA
ncbi:MAG: GAF domain-containing protein, partial [Chloroflexota bacterium]